MTGLAHVPDTLTADAATRGEGHAGLWLLAGHVLVQAGFIAVTLLVFAYLQDRSETITVALIGLVFASLRASTLSGACAQQRVALLLENEIKSVRRNMAEHLESLPASDIELDRGLDALAKPLRIDYAGLAIVGAICFYHLAIAIFFGAAYQELLGLH